MRQGSQKSRHGEKGHGASWGIQKGESNGGGQKKTPQSSRSDQKKVGFFVQGHASGLSVCIEGICIARFPKSVTEKRWSLGGGECESSARGNGGRRGVTNYYRGWPETKKKKKKEKKKGGGGNGNSSRGLGGGHADLSGGETVPVKYLYL